MPPPDQVSGLSIGCRRLIAAVETAALLQWLSRRWPDWAAAATAVPAADEHDGEADSRVLSHARSGSHTSGEAEQLAGSETAGPSLINRYERPQPLFSSS